MDTVLAVALPQRPLAGCPVANNLSYPEPVGTFDVSTARRRPSGSISTIHSFRTIGVILLPKWNRALLSQKPCSEEAPGQGPSKTSTSVAVVQRTGSSHPGLDRPPRIRRKQSA